MPKITIDLKPDEMTAVNDYIDFCERLTNIRPPKAKVCHDLVIKGLEKAKGN